MSLFTKGIYVLYHNSNPQSGVEYVPILEMKCRGFWVKHIPREMEMPQILEIFHTAHTGRGVK